VATFSAIADVSEILRRTLHAGVQTVGATCIIHDLVAAPSTAMTLSLTLYEVAEDPSSRNRPDIRQVVNNQVLLTRSPTALLLRYLITAWSGNIVDDQVILGRAVQTLYEHAILSGADLAGTSLIANDEAIAITMIQQSIEDRTHVWRAYEKPYRLSINYEVRVVKIDSSKPPKILSQVRSRHLRHGIIEEVP
jgi:Pvc16 N-terminal domain